jgi:hypothetical protein
MVFVASALAAALSPAAIAQSSPTSTSPALQSVPRDLDDWGGYYNIVRGNDLGDLKPIGLNWHDLVVSHLQPWARMKMETTDGVADDPGSVCQPDGIFRLITQAGIVGFLPTPEVFYIVGGEPSTYGVERVFIDREHPKRLLPTWGGHSVGRWDGETLVVDTIGFNDKSWLTPAMEPHTEDAHMIKRIRRVQPSGFIEITTTVEDRKALTSAYRYSRYYRKVSDTIPENVCNEDPLVWKDFKMRHLQPLVEHSREVK